MRIGYFGDGPWAHESLNRLVSLQGVEVAFLCTRFNMPDQTLIKLAANYDISVLIEKNVNSHTFLNKIREQQCDLCV